MSSPSAEPAWRTHAPAKINLDLRMRGLRADGYHLLSTTLQSIGLADTLTLRARPGPFAIACDTPGVPTDARNLAWKGAAAMAAALGVPLEGWSLHLEKAIPAEAGLGGGSSDAVAAARLVARAVGAVVPPGRLADLVAPLGADVAFFAWGGTSRGEGVGDAITPLPDALDAAVVLVRPPFGVSTRDAYAWYDADRAALPPADDPGVRRSEPRRQGSAMASTNDLEVSVARRHPAIRTIVERLRGAGARLAAMSGSGSACFGLYEPSSDLALVEGGWPDGAIVWRTRLLSRDAYTGLTRCEPTR